jgi:hypothetical protein
MEDRGGLEAQNGAPEGLQTSSRRFHIRVKSWIRFRIRVKSWIQIRI